MTEPLRGRNREDRASGAEHDAFRGATPEGGQKSLMPACGEHNEVGGARRFNLSYLLHDIATPNSPVPFPSLVARCVQNGHISCVTHMRKRKEDLFAAEDERKFRGCVHCGLWGGRLIDGYENTFQRQATILDGDKPFCRLRNKKCHRPRPARDGFRARFVRPPGEPIALMRREYNQIDPPAFEVMQNRSDGIRAGSENLLWAQTEVSNRRSRTSRRNDPPAFERPTHARKIDPIHIDHIRADMHDVQLGLGNQRKLEGVRESDLARPRKVRGMENAVQRKGCFFHPGIHDRVLLHGGTRDARNNKA